MPASTAAAIERLRTRGGRIVAIGTTVVRALEHAAGGDGIVRPSEGLATNRIDRATRITLVDVLLSGTHEPGTSHFALLEAFAPRELLLRAFAGADAAGFLAHEFGDLVWIPRTRRPGA